MSRLDETQSFLDLYLYHIGQSEVPSQFHEWAAMSLLAASVSGRVWVQVSPERRIQPNLYVMLIGPSGSGKEQAIGRAQRMYWEAGDYSTLYIGRATRRGLIQWFIKGAHPVSERFWIVQDARIYIMTEELSAGLPPGDHGWDLITFLTAMYIPPPVMDDSTGLNGTIQLRDPMINWLAGTTEDWLRASLQGHALSGGFFPRIMAVYGQRDTKLRYPHILVPEDAPVVREHLLDRITGYHALHGPAVLTPEADELRCEWYRNEPDPEPEATPNFNRRDEMVYRLSLVHCLSDMVWNVNDTAPTETIIHSRHVQKGIESWQRLMQDTGKTVQVAHATPHSENSDWIKAIIQRAGTIDHSLLLMRAGKRSIRAKDLKEILETLVECGDVDPIVTTGESGRTRRGYRFKEPA